MKKKMVSSLQQEYSAWKTRSLADRDYVYVWADGVHFNVRLEDERLTALFFFQAEDGIRDVAVTGVQTCALPIWPARVSLIMRPSTITPARVQVRNSVSRC